MEKDCKDKLVTAFITLSSHCWSMGNCASCIFFKNNQCVFSTSAPDKWKMPSELKGD